MKRVFIAIAFLLACTLSGCSKYSTTPPKSMSPEETVKYYFSQFNDKNQSGMNFVLYKKIQGTNADLKNLISVTLNNCVEEKDSSKIEIDDAWYENPYKVAMVYVTFDIKYKGVGGDGLSNGEYKWKYYLVKESEKSDWVIVQWGGG